MGGCMGSCLTHLHLFAYDTYCVCLLLGGVGMYPMYQYNVRVAECGENGSLRCARKSRGSLLVLGSVLVLCSVLVLVLEVEG